MMYYLSGINAIVLQWLQRDCDKSVKEIADIVSTCIFGPGGNIKNLLPGSSD